MFSPVDMPVNVPFVKELGDVEVTSMRTGAESAEVVFRSKATKEIVLSAKGAAAGPSIDISTVDTVFWDIRINGVPATRAQWSKVMQPGSDIDLIANAEERRIDVTWRE